MMPIIAYNYSSGNYKRMKETMRAARTTGIVAAIISVAFYELSALQLMHLFIKNEETARLGSNFLMARALATPFSFADFHYMYTFQSLGANFNDRNQDSETEMYFRVFFIPKNQMVLFL